MIAGIIKGNEYNS